jgi:hypothetical protein
MDSTTRDPKLEALAEITGPRASSYAWQVMHLDDENMHLGRVTSIIEAAMIDAIHSYVSSVRVPESASACNCPMCDQPFDCPNGHIASVREGMAQIERGEFVTLDQMREEMAAPEFASVQEAGKRTPDVWWAEYRRRNFARWHKVGPFRTEEQARNSIPRDAANFSITRDIATETIGSQEVATPSLTVQEAAAEVDNG